MALISTLTDNFDDNSRDAAKWQEGSAGVAEVNQELEFTTTLAASTQEIYSTVDTYELTSSQTTIKIVDAGNFSLVSYYWSFGMFPNDWSHWLGWLLDNDGVHARFDSTNYTTNTYVANTYRYLRIRESGGTTYWEYSSDGINWNVEHSVANPMTVTDIMIRLAAETWDTELSTTTLKIDDFNILPSATATGIMTPRTGFWGDL